MQNLPKPTEILFDHGGKRRGSDSLTRNRVAEEGLINVVGSLACTAAAVATAWDQVAVLTLVGWGLYMQLVNLGGLLLLLRFRNDPPEQHRWRISLVAYSAASGIGWGVAAYVLGDSALPTQQLVLVAVVISAATCWHWSFLSSWPALVLFDGFSFGRFDLRAKQYLQGCRDIRTV